jgi:hypothetical protein
MDKVKIALTVLSIVIIVGPIASVVFAYRDNLLGLVVPPEVNSLVNGNFTGSQFQPPMPVGEPQYNPETRTFTFPFNFTNPLKNEISIDQLSAKVKCKDNNALLGNISINEPIKIGPGETAIINATGSLSQDAINQLKAQYSGSSNINVAFENLDVVVGGVKVHLDELDAGSIPLPGGIG